MRGDRRRSAHRWTCAHPTYERTVSAHLYVRTYARRPMCACVRLVYLYRERRAMRASAPSASRRECRRRTPDALPRAKQGNPLPSPKILVSRK